MQLKLGQAFSLACLIEFGSLLPNGQVPIESTGHLKERVALFRFGGKALLDPAFLGLVDHAFFRFPFTIIDALMTTWSPRLAQMSLERGCLRPT